MVPDGPSADSPDPLETLVLAAALALVVGELALLALDLPGGTAESARLGLGLLGMTVAGLATVAAAARSPAGALLGVVALPLSGLYAVTGLLLPWTELSFLVGQTLVEVLLVVPVLGEPLARLVVDGYTLSEATLERAFRIHYALVGLLAVGVVVAVGRLVWTRLPAGQTGSPKQ